MDRIPVIDIEPFLRGTAAGRDVGRTAVPAAMREAAEEIGFFAIDGHGVPRTTMDALYDKAHAFFDLPLEEKQRVAPPRPDYPRGYKAVGFEALAAGNELSTPPDLKEYYHFGRPEIPADAYYTGEQGRRHFFVNRWPKRPGGFSEAADAYYLAMEQLSATLCRIAALALGLPENFFDDKIDRHITAARINYYPRQDDPPAEGQLRAGAHTDYGMLTILSGESAPGPAGSHPLGRVGRCGDRQVPVRVQHRRPAHALDQRPLGFQHASRAESAARDGESGEPHVDRFFPPPELRREDRMHPGLRW